MIALNRVLLSCNTLNHAILTSSFVRLFGRGLPAYFGHVCVEGKDSVVLSAVTAHFDQFAACLHIG